MNTLNQKFKIFVSGKKDTAKRLPLEGKLQTVDKVVSTFKRWGHFVYGLTQIA